MNQPEKLLSLYLIRHGQTRHNLGVAVEEPDIKSQHDPELTETGHSQALALGQYYSDTDFDYIFSSGLNRAVTTASYLRNAQKKEKPLYICPIASEIATPHEYKGESFEELKKAFLYIVPAPGFDLSDRTVISDGCRDPKPIYERAGRILDYFRSSFTHGEKVALVSHAGIITYIIYYLLGFRDFCPETDFEILNTGVTEISFYKPGTFRDDIVIEYVNSLRHQKD